MLKMNLEYDKGILFVRLDGVLNRSTSYKVNNYLVPVLLKHKIKYLVYNFYFLEDIDDNGLDALLNTKFAINLISKVFLPSKSLEISGISITIILTPLLIK